VVQLFVKNNLRWFGAPFTEAEVGRYREQLAAAKLACVFGHTGYLLNLAAPSGPNRDKSLQSLIQEIQLAAQLSLPFLVMHPGAHLGRGEAQGLKQTARGLDEAFAATRRCPVRIALEVTAGQGTCLGGQLRHLAEVYQRLRWVQRLGVCLDTAHLLAAGYDLRLPQGWDALIVEADRLFGLKEILAVHLNDSQAELGSRRDRHAGIGQGKIGRAAFRHIVNDPRFRQLPGCLETPKSPDLHEDRENLAILRSLRRRA
jgi:deoxyribonuclease-4